MTTLEPPTVSPAKRDAYLEQAQRIRIRAWALGLCPCPECQGEGRLPCMDGCGDQAGGYAETCPECHGKQAQR